jgi:hypothetical protein
MADPVFPVIALEGNPSEFSRMVGGTHVIDPSLIPPEVALLDGSTLTGVTLDSPNVTGNFPGHTHLDASSGSQITPRAMSPRPRHRVSSSVAASAAVVNTVAETTFSVSHTLLADSVLAGEEFWIRFRGKATTVGAATLRLRAKLGGTTIADVNVITYGGAVVNQPWGLDVLCVPRVGGAAGTLLACGFAFGTAAPLVPHYTGAVDWTAGQALILTAQWSVADPVNSTTLEHMLVEL